MKINTNKLPKIPYLYWTIEEHTKGGKVDLKDMALHLEPEQEKGYLTGTVLRERLKGQKPLNACVLDYLEAHPEKTPEEWKGKYIFFWGTIFRGSSGGLFVRYWCWSEGRWQSYFSWLGYGWDGNYPSAVLRKSSVSDPKPYSELSDLELRITKLEQTLEAVREALSV